MPKRAATDNAVASVLSQPDPSPAEVAQCRGRHFGSVPSAGPNLARRARQGYDRLLASPATTLARPGPLARLAPHVGLIDLYRAAKLVGFCWRPWRT